MKVIIVEPGKEGYIAEIGNELEDLQEVVGGYIEAIYPFDDEVAIVCDDEGKLKSKAKNRIMTSDGIPYDILCGTFFVCGLGEEDFASLSDELAEKYLEVFANIKSIEINI